MTTRKSSITPLSNKSQPVSPRISGIRIFARMMYEVERVQAYEASIVGMQPHSLFAAYRYQGEPQDNIALRYLQQAMRHGDECVAGFCAAISDLLGDSEAGGRSFTKVYMQASESELEAPGDEPVTRKQVHAEARHA